MSNATEQDRVDVLGDMVSRELLPSVEAGIEWLNDEYEGPSWANEIDLPRLDMGSARLCVAGQLFEDEHNLYGYDVVTNKVDTSALGFSVDYSLVGSIEGEDIAYSVLTNLWYDAITAIREGIHSA